jgi:hypothetical protein
MLLLIWRKLPPVTKGCGPISIIVSSLYPWSFSQMLELAIPFPYFLTSGIVNPVLIQF